MECVKRETGLLSSAERADANCKCSTVGRARLTTTERTWADCVGERHKRSNRLCIFLFTLAPTSTVALTLSMGPRSFVGTIHHR